MLDGNVALLSLYSFQDDTTIKRLVEENEDCLKATRGLIIDVRDCQGDNEEALLPILPYVIEKQTALNAFLPERFLFRNSANNRALFRNFLEWEFDEDRIELDWMNDLFYRLERSNDNEMVPFVVESSSQCKEPMEPLCSNPVVILSDAYTSGVAETLVELGKSSRRCKVVGRNTMGTLDTMVSAAFAIGNWFTLEVPLACSEQRNMQKHEHTIGITPDIYIPWSPNALIHDEDISYALSLLGNKTYRKMRQIV